MEEAKDDLISRRAATQIALEFIVEYLGGAFDEDLQKKLIERMNAISSAQPEQDILSWLLAYHTKSFDLHGRYMPHEVIGWLVHDFANAYMAERREE